MKKKVSYSGDEMKRYLGSLKEHFTDGLKAIGEQYFDLKKGINRIDAKLDSYTEMIGNIMIRLEEIKNEFKQKVDYQDFAKLQIRVAHLEAASSGRR